MAASLLSSFSFGLHGYFPFLAFAWAHSLAQVGLREFGFTWPFGACDLMAHCDPMGDAVARGAEVLVGKVLVARIRHRFLASSV